MAMVDEEAVRPKPYEGEDDMVERLQYAASLGGLTAADLKTIRDAATYIMWLRRIFHTRLGEIKRLEAELEVAQKTVLGLDIKHESALLRIKDLQTALWKIREIPDVGPDPTIEVARDIAIEALRGGK